MAIKNTIICDDCNKQIATHKCAVCNADLCKNCARVFELISEISNGLAITLKRAYSTELKPDDIVVCDECTKITNGCDADMKKHIFEVLKKIMIEKGI